MQYISRCVKAQLEKSTIRRLILYRAFSGFGQAKVRDVDLVLGSRQFLILLQLPSCLQNCTERLVDLGKLKFVMLI